MLQSCAVLFLARLFYSPKELDVVSSFATFVKNMKFKAFKFKLTVKVMVFSDLDSLLFHGMHLQYASKFLKDLINIVGRKTPGHNTAFSLELSFI